MNTQRIFRFLCYDNELTWLHHYSMWLTNIMLNVLFLFSDNTQNGGRGTIVLINGLLSLYFTVSYYEQFSGINMPSTVKSYCDPVFYTSYWSYVSYHGVNTIIGNNVIGVVNVMYMVAYSCLSVMFVARRYMIITHPDEFNQYIEKCDFYKKPTIDFGEVIIS